MPMCPLRTSMSDSVVHGGSPGHPLQCAHRVHDSGFDRTGHHNKCGSLKSPKAAEFASPREAWKSCIHIHRGRCRS